MLTLNAVGGVKLRQSAFTGKPVGRSVSRVAAKPFARGSQLRVTAEKVVGIDLGTTNSAVRVVQRRGLKRLEDAQPPSSMTFVCPSPRSHGTCRWLPWRVASRLL